MMMLALATAAAAAAQVCGSTAWQDVHSVSLDGDRLYLCVDDACWAFDTASASFTPIAPIIDDDSPEAPDRDVAMRTVANEAGTLAVIIYDQVNREGSALLLDLRHGRSLQRVPGGESVWVGNDAFVIDDVLYDARGRKLSNLELTLGRIDFPFVAAELAARHAIVVGDVTSGRFALVDTRTGRTRWRLTLDGDNETRAFSTVLPAADGKSIYIVDGFPFAGRVSVVDAATGKLRRQDASPACRP